MVEKLEEIKQLNDKLFKRSFNKEEDPIFPCFQYILEGNRLTIESQVILTKGIEKDELLSVHKALVRKEYIKVTDNNLLELYANFYVECMMTIRFSIISDSEDTNKMFKKIYQETEDNRLFTPQQYF